MLQILVYGKFAVKTGHLENHTDPSPDRFHASRQIDAKNIGVASRGKKIGREDME